MLEDGTLWTWLLIFLVGILSWILLAFISTFLLSVLKDARLSYQAIAQPTIEYLNSLWRQCWVAAKSSFDFFYQSHAFRYLVDQNQFLWQQALSQTLTEIRQLEQKSTLLTKEFESTHKALIRADNMLHKRDDHFPVLPAVPDTQDLWVEVKEVRRATATLILAGLVALAIMIVNTGMLSRILKDLDLGFTIYGSVRLYHVIAFLFTLVELGLGIIYSKIGENTKQLSAGTHLARLVPIIFAFALAFAEGVFYSQAGMETSLPAPFQGTRSILQIEPAIVNLSYAFGVLGCTLPLILFGLGHICYQALMTIRDGYALDHMRMDLKKISRNMHYLQENFRTVEATIHKAREQYSQILELFAAVKPDTQDAISRTVKETSSQVLQCSKTPPEWARSRLESLTPAESQQEGYRVLAWTVMTGFISFTSIWLHSWAIALQYTDLMIPLPTVMAIAQVAVLLATGLLLRSEQVLLNDNQDIIVRVASTRVWANRTAVSVIALLVITANWGLLSKFPGSLGLAGLLVLGLGAALLLLGKDFPIMLSMIACLALASLAIVRGILAWIGLVGIRLSIGALFLAEFLLRLVAAPVQWYTQQRSVQVAVPSAQIRE